MITTIWRQKVNRRLLIWPRAPVEYYVRSSENQEPPKLSLTYHVILHLGSPVPVVSDSFAFATSLQRKASATTCLVHAILLLNQHGNRTFLLFHRAASFESPHGIRDMVLQNACDQTPKESFGRLSRKQQDRKSLPDKICGRCFRPGRCFS
jgi:hypothetical protein